MRDRSRLGIGCVTVIVAVGMSTSTGAEAATVIVGSPLTANFTGTLAGGPPPTTDANTALPEPGATATSPVPGTIINWRVILGSPGELSLVVLKPAAGGAYTPGLGESGVHTNNAGLQTFPSGLQVKPGDLIGLVLNGQPVKEATTVSGGTISEWAYPFFYGSSRPPDTTHDNAELAYNATVEYCLVPKLKGKKLGAAKRALANGGCRVGEITRAKRGKAKFVKSQGEAPGTALADQAPVNLKLGPKKKRK
jgi:hypothetical protein